MIGEDAFFDLYIEPTMKTYIAHRLEGIARSYFARKIIDHTYTDIYDIGTYWYDDAESRENGEFDCVLRHVDSYSFYEVKLQNHPMTKSECDHERKQVEKRTGSIRINRIGFISSSGYLFKDDSYDLLTLQDLYR